MSKDAATHTSAPGRVILFGEHAMNFGEPSVAIAVDMRVGCSVQLSGRFMVNEEELNHKKHLYIRSALLNGWTDMDRPIALATEFGIPPELGLGDTAAGTVAFLGALSMMHDHIIFEHVARNAFQTHSEVNGRGLPLDVSASTHGGAILLDGKADENTLWSLAGKDRTWHAHDIPLPEMELVLGYSGVPAPALEMRNKIFRFQQRNSFARDIIKDIGKVSRDGAAALASGNIPEVGRLMGMNHRLLVNLGVGNPALEKLVQAAARHSHGAKITGPGGGGCIIALAKDTDRVSSAIESAGGKAFRLSVAMEGVRPED